MPTSPSTRREAALSGLQMATTRACPSGPSACARSAAATSRVTVAAAGREEREARSGASSVSRRSRLHTPSGSGFAAPMHRPQADAGRRVERQVRALDVGARAASTVAASRGPMKRTQSGSFSSAWMNAASPVVSARDLEPLGGEHAHVGFACGSSPRAIASLNALDAPRATLSVFHCAGPTRCLASSTICPVHAVVLQLAAHGRAREHRLRADGDRAVEVFLGQAVERGEQARPALLPAVEEPLLRERCRVVELAVAIAVRLLAVGRGSPSSARACCRSCAA